MGVINLTPHPICFYSPDTPDRASDAQLAAGLVGTIPASGLTARLRTTDLGVRGSVDVEGLSVPVYAVQYGEVDGLPKLTPGVVCVVPLLTALASRREDLVVPDSLVRNLSGTVVGCRRFGFVA